MTIATGPDELGRFEDVFVDGAQSVSIKISGVSKPVAEPISEPIRWRVSPGAPGPLTALMAYVGMQIECLDAEPEHGWLCSRHRGSIRQCRKRACRRRRRRELLHRFAELTPLAPPVVR